MRDGTVPWKVKLWRRIVGQPNDSGDMVRLRSVAASVFRIPGTVVVQEALTVVYRRVGTIRSPAALTGWLLTVIARLCCRR